MRAAKFLVIGVIALLAGYAVIGVKNARVGNPVTTLELEGGQGSFFRRASMAAPDVQPEIKPECPTIGSSAPGNRFFPDRSTQPARQAPLAHCKDQAVEP